MSCIDGIVAAIGETAFIVRGGFHPDASEAMPRGPDGAEAATILLVGNVGAEFWPAFSQQMAGGHRTIDAWTRAVLEPVAAVVGAAIVFPFDRPYWPFQQWAMRAEGLQPSPVGILIHPEHGLWHAYRAALVFAARLDLPDRPSGPVPCNSCVGRPCLSACPVSAFSDGGYDHRSCTGHLGTGAGQDCLIRGCRARAACPVGESYPPAQIRFHMAAFRRNHVADCQP